MYLVLTLTEYSNKSWNVLCTIDVMITAISICFFYVLLIFIFTKIFGVKYTEIGKNVKNIKRGIIYPIGITTLLLTTFAISLHWVPKVFKYSPQISQQILLVIPIVTIISIFARFSLLRGTLHNKKRLLFLSMATLIVGFSEELLVRGIAVSALQNAGYSVILVGVFSSLIFGALHFVNYFNGQDVRKTATQVAGTICMGLNFYFILILSGTLWLPILIHFLYDFSILSLGVDFTFPNTVTTKVVTVSTLLMFILPVIGLLFLI